MTHRAYIARLGNGILLVSSGLKENDLQHSYPGSTIEFEQVGDAVGTAALAKSLNEFSTVQLEDFIKNMKKPAQVIVFKEKKS